MSLALVVLSQLVIAADFDIVYVALPEIGRHLGFDGRSIQWVVSAYTIVLGGLLLVGGRAADRLGARRMLIAGLILFGLASLTAGLAASPEALVVSRAVQGLGAALFTPASLKLIGSMFPEGAERGRAFGIWGLAGSAGAATGAVGGGVLTGFLGWEWVFFVNVPVTLVAVLAAPRLLPADKLAHLSSGSFDIPGALLATGGTTLIVFGLVSGSGSGWWAPDAAGVLSVGVALIAGFLLFERRVDEPLVPLALLRHRTLAIAMILAFLFMAAMGTQYYLFTIYLQDVLDYSALRAGLAFLPLSMLSAIGSGWLFPRFLGRVGLAGTMFMGLAGFAVSILLVAIGMSAGGSYLGLLPGIVAWGLFAGIGFPGIFAAAGTGVPPERQGVAAGLVLTAQYIGGAIGLAVLVGIATSGIDEASASADVVAGLRRAAFAGAAIVAAGSLLALRLPRLARATRADVPIPNAGERGGISAG